MSSRLFQEVREKRGLAYSVYSFLHSFSDTGMLGIYAGCDPGRVEELLAVLGKETARLAGTLTEEDIQTAKQQIKGNVILAAESSEARMNRLAKGEHYFGRLISLDEIIAALEGVTEEELAVQAEKMVGASPISIVALGPVSEDGDIFGAFRQ
jgi:predicted Zn-dependent peptidase